MSGCPVLPQLLRSDHSGRSPGLPRETGFQAFGLLPDAADLEILTLSTPLAIRLPLSPTTLSSGLGLELVDAISPHTGPEDSDEPTESEIPRALGCLFFIRISCKPIKPNKVLDSLVI